MQDNVLFDHPTREAFLRAPECVKPDDEQGGQERELAAIAMQLQETASYAIDPQFYQKCLEECKEKFMHHRQGDILFVKIDMLPDGLQKRPGDIIVEGESTGHAHRLLQGDILEAGSMLYLSIEIETSVVHEEHRPIKLVPGYYQVIRQREYSPEAIRTVVD